MFDLLHFPPYFLLCFLFFPTGVGSMSGQTQHGHLGRPLHIIFLLIHSLPKSYRNHHAILSSRNLGKPVVIRSVWRRRRRRRKEEEEKKKKKRKREMRTLTDLRKMGIFRFILSIIEIIAGVLSSWPQEACLLLTILIVLAILVLLLLWIASRRCTFVKNRVVLTVLFSVFCFSFFLAFFSCILGCVLSIILIVLAVLVLLLLWIASPRWSFRRGEESSHFLCFVFVFLFCLLFAFVLLSVIFSHSYRACRSRFAPCIRCFSSLVLSSSRRIESCSLSFSLHLRHRPFTFPCSVCTEKRHVSAPRGRTRPQPQPPTPQHHRQQHQPESQGRNGQRAARRQIRSGQRNCRKSTFSICRR